MERNLNNLKLVEKKDPIKIITPVLKNDELKKEMAISISQGLCTIPEDLVNLFNISYEQAITLLNDPGFLTLIANTTKAKLNLNFHTKSIPKLLDIVDSGDNKEAMQAIKLVAQLSNNLKSVGTDVNINLNLENLVRESEKNIIPSFDTSFQRMESLTEGNKTPNFDSSIIDLEKVG